MAKSKIISYDLCKSGRNYDDLYKYIKNFPEWARITESAWFVSSDKTCENIRNEIMSIVDSNDRIFVAELNGVAAWYNVICDSEYLKTHI